MEALINDGHIELLSYLTSSSLETRIWFQDIFIKRKLETANHNTITEEAICYYCDCSKHRIECFLFPQEQIRRAEVKTSVTPAEWLSRGFFVTFD